MKSILLFFTAILINTSSAWAFRFTPMVAEVSPHGEHTSQVFIVENNSKEKIAIQFKITGRSYELEGKEVRNPSSDFMIYPEQMALEANDKRNLRITYIGPKNIQVEKPYRLIATQLPVEFQKTQKKSKLNFLLEYVAALYVTPNGVFPLIKVLSAHVVNSRKIELEIENQGSRHQLLNSAELELTTQPKQEIEVLKKSLEEFRSENLLPQEKRKIQVELSQALKKDTEITAKITFPESNP